jgi:hypothetical protein
MQKLTVNSLQVGKPTKAKQGNGATSPKINNPFLSHNQPKSKPLHEVTRPRAVTVASATAGSHATAADPSHQ